MIKEIDDFNPTLASQQLQSFEGDIEQDNQRYNEDFGILHDIIYQFSNNTKDKIVSCVDPDARIAHKSPGNIKKRI